MVCSIVPPYVLESLARNADEHVRDAARRSLALTATLRRERSSPRTPPAAPSGGEERSVYDAHRHEHLPGKLVRREGEPDVTDAAVNHAYNAAGTTWEFYRAVLGRNSIDARGMPLRSTVHFGDRFDNAFWNNAQMVYGDGDGVVFGDFTQCIDVIAHEMTHGVTQHECNLAYEGQSGALNESLSDVFGSLVKQWQRSESAHDADWLIGAGLLLPGVNAHALRSMKAPGTAYNDPVLGGRDPQPAHLRDYVETAADEGGVHVNSGIPNHAFYRFATAIGGNAWEIAGPIWYAALCSDVGSDCNFHQFARATIEAAGAYDAAIRNAAHAAWSAVGITVAARIVQ